MNQSIVSSASISESNWVDYIFSSADTVGKYVTSSNIVSRRRGYIWFLMRELNQDRTIDDQRNQSTELKWYYVVQNLKWFLWKWQKQRNTVKDEYLNDVDLMGDEFENRPIVTLQRPQGIIRYTVEDVVGLLGMYLQNRNEFSADSKIPMHPYLNQEWSTGDLYKVQGWLRKQTLKPMETPIPVLIWLQTPYVIQTLPSVNAKPYIMDDYVELNARYLYTIETRHHRDVQVQNLRTIMTNVGIKHSCVDWNRVASLEDEEWNHIFQSLIVLWYHPLSEWMVDNVNASDVRTEHWKKNVMDRLRMAKCLYRQQRRIYVRRNRRQNRRIGRM